MEYFKTIDEETMKMYDQLQLVLLDDINANDLEAQLRDTSLTLSNSFKTLVCIKTLSINCC